MSAKRLMPFLVLLLGSTSGLGYLVELKLYLKEEMIPAAVSHVLNSENLTQMFGVTSKDLLQLTKLDQYGLTEISDVLQGSGVMIDQVFSVNFLQILSTTFNIPFGDFFPNVTAKLQLSEEQTDDLIESFEVSQRLWKYISLKKEDKIFNLLRDGVYDENHTENALKVIGKTRDEVYVVFRDTFVEKLLDMDCLELLRLMKDNSSSLFDFTIFFHIFNVTIYDVYKVEKFRNILTNITDSLNMNVTLGVVVGPKQIALHTLAYSQLDSNVDSDVKVQANDTEVFFDQYRHLLGDRIIEVTSNLPLSDTIEITETYNNTGNCSYATLINGTLEIEDVEVDNLTFTKSNTTYFYLGSPLICQDKLFGLAREDNETTIFFDGFYTKDNPPAPPAPPNNGGFNTPIVSIVTLYFFTMLTLL